MQRLAAPLSLLPLAVAAAPAAAAGPWTVACRRANDSVVVSSRVYYYDGGDVQLDPNHTDPQLLAPSPWGNVSTCWAAAWQGYQDGCSQNFPTLVCQFEDGDGAPQWGATRAFFLAVGVQQPPQAYTQLAMSVLPNLTDLLASGPASPDRWMFVIPGSIWATARTSMCMHTNRTLYPHAWRTLETSSLVNAVLAAATDTPTLTDYVLGGVSAGAVAAVSAAGDHRLYDGTATHNMTGRRMAGAVLLNPGPNSVVTEDLTAGGAHSFQPAIWGAAKRHAVRDNSTFSVLCSNAATNSYVECNGANDYLRHWHGATGLDTVPTGNGSGFESCEEQKDWLHCWHNFIKGKKPRPTVPGFWDHNVPENCNMNETLRSEFESKLVQAIQNRITVTDGCRAFGCGVEHLQTKWMHGDGRGCQAVNGMSNGLDIDSNFSFPVCGAPLREATCNNATDNCDSCVWRGCFGLGIDPDDKGPVCNNRTHLCEPNETHWECPYPYINTDGRCGLDAHACDAADPNCTVCDNDRFCVNATSSAGSASSLVCLLPNTSWVQQYPTTAELDRVFKCQECSAVGGDPGYAGFGFPGQLGRCGKGALEYAPICDERYECKGCGPKAPAGRALACNESSEGPVCLESEALCGCTEHSHCNQSQVGAYCNATMQTCVRCAYGLPGWQCDVHSDEPVCQWGSGLCGCQSNFECYNSSAGGMCNTTISRCASCSSGFTCAANSTLPVCQPTGMCGCSADEDCATYNATAVCDADSASCVPCQDLVTLAQGIPELSTLAAALVAAGLDTTLRGKGPFTVFAPADGAFAKLPNATLASLLQDPGQLYDVLAYHVVAGKVASRDLVDGAALVTLEGQNVTVHVAGGAVRINTANVTQADVGSCNGVVHLIDALLLPQVPWCGLPCVAEEQCRACGTCMLSDPRPDLPPNTTVCKNPGLVP